MPIIKGSSTNPIRINLGGVNELQKVYLGANLVWDKVTASPGGCVEYGYLYNYYAASDSRNMANINWAVPTLNDFNTLIQYLSTTYSTILSINDDYFGTEKDSYYTDNDSVFAIREESSLHWSNNTDATNLEKFTAVGNGYRQYDGDFVSLKEVSMLGTSQLPDWGSGWWISLYIGGGSNATPTSPNGYIDELFTTYEREICGMAIRLVKDSTTLSHGETGTYIGNDGTVYQTICIGTQEWLAENLIETQYHNGDPIPTVEDATTWSGLTTGAKCAYNNDYTNVGCGETVDSSSTLDYPLYSNGEQVYSVGCDQFGPSITTEQETKDSIDLHISLLNSGCSTNITGVDNGHRIKSLTVGQQVYNRYTEGVPPPNTSLDRWMFYYTYEAGTGYNGYTYYVAFVDINAILTTIYEYPIV